MNWFKEKCSHLYEEIGKCYDRIDYGNGTYINAYIVKKCKICGNITAKTVYSNEFTRYTSPVRVDDCVKKLIAKRNRQRLMQKEKQKQLRLKLKLKQK